MMPNNAEIMYQKENPFLQTSTVCQKSKP